MLLVYQICRDDIISLSIYSSHKILDLSSNRTIFINVTQSYEYHVSISMCLLHYRMQNHKENL